MIFSSITFDQPKKSLKKLKGDFVSSSEMDGVTAAIKLQPEFLTSPLDRHTNNTWYSIRRGEDSEEPLITTFKKWKVTDL